MSPVFRFLEVTIFLVIGFKGQCEAQVDHCNPSPCANGGTCLERVDGFVCQCTIDYTGVKCDIPDYCRSGPCHHGGKCRDTRTGYVCDCTGTGYEGLTCDAPFDDCTPNPCLHGGTCMDAFKSYSCRCIPGFDGKNCEVEMSACVSNPCQHKGTCIDVHPGSDPTMLSPSYRCLCVDGIAGDNCEVNYNDCWMKPCQHGVCVDGIKSYTCDCSGSGYSGVHCEHKNIDQCLLHPCQNSGTCVQDGDDYHCDCLPFQEGLITHGGKNCSVLLRGCENVHSCLNGAVCVPVLLNEAKNIHSYTCSCAHGFRGKVCDAVTSMTMAAGSYIRKTYKSDFTLKVRFRTSDENGVLIYDRIGQRFVSVEMMNGSLYLVSGDNTGYNWTMEAITSSLLSDSHWHSLVLTSGVNTTLTLDDPLCNTTADCVLSLPLSHSTGSFREIFIGHVTVVPWLRTTMSKHEFVGCIEDVMFNGDIIVPDNFGVAEFHNTKLNCAACLTGTCQGLGQCNPVGNTDFKCVCPSGLQNGICTEDSVIPCDFETGLCKWTHGSPEDFDWTRSHGATGSTDTGPSGDHTTGSGYYMYTEASSPRTQGQKALLVSPYFIVGGPTCVTFWSNMYGSTMGEIRLLQKIGSSEYTLITLRGNQGTSWTKHEALLRTASNTRLVFEGRIGSGYYSDMAIDDIDIKYTSC